MSIPQPMLQVIDLIPFPIFWLSDIHQGVPQSKQVPPGLLMKGELYSLSRILKFTYLILYCQKMEDFNSSYLLNCLVLATMIFMDQVLGSKQQYDPDLNCAFKNVLQFSKHRSLLSTLLSEQAFACLINVLPGIESLAHRG